MTPEQRENHINLVRRLHAAAKETPRGSLHLTVEQVEALLSAIPDVPGGLTVNVTRSPQVEEFIHRGQAAQKAVDQITPPEPDSLDGAPRVKPQSEIQRAHDILHFICGPDGPPVFKDAKIVGATHDCLAWVLGYECGQAFQENIEAALEVLKRMGFREVDIGAPISSEEARKRGLG